MSKATELANKIASPPDAEGWRDLPFVSDLDAVAAHLRALDASHRQLLEALEGLYFSCPTSLECKDFHHSKLERHSGLEACKPAADFLASLSRAHAAIAAAKELA